jgi:hypothetical protein
MRVACSIRQLPNLHRLGLRHAPCADARTHSGTGRAPAVRAVRAMGNRHARRCACAPTGVAGTTGAQLSFICSKLMKLFASSSIGRPHGCVSCWIAVVARPVCVQLTSRLWIRRGERRVRRAERAAVGPDAGRRGTCVAGVGGVRGERAGWAVAPAGAAAGQARGRVAGARLRVAAAADTGGRGGGVRGGARAGPRRGVVAPCRAHGYAHPPPTPPQRAAPNLQRLRIIRGWFSGRLTGHGATLRLVAAACGDVDGTLASTRTAARFPTGLAEAAASNLAPLGPLSPHSFRITLRCSSRQRSSPPRQPHLSQPAQRRQRRQASRKS